MADKLVAAGACQSVAPFQGVEPPAAPYLRVGRCFQEKKQMLDVIFLAVGLGFFALSVGYVYACDWL
ncbi:MAG: hypothetical protein AB7S93_24365 [Xanthobacteraceae bacterium]